MGTFGMDRTPDFPETLAAFGVRTCSSLVDEKACHSTEHKMSDMEPNLAVDSFLGLGMENMGINSKMEEFDFSFLPDYGGIHFCSTQDREAGLKLEILDGFLDEVEDIYASQDLSSIGHDAFLPETQVKKNVSELDGKRIGISEWSKETLAHVESQNVSYGKVEDSLDTSSKDMHCFYESEDDKKPLSTFIGSWVDRGRNRKKNMRNTACTRLDSCMSYDFRPRKGPLKILQENTLSDEQLTSSESEDEIAVSKSKSDRRKNQRMWTVDEVVKLLDGISHFGVGKWTGIKKLFFHSASHRTPIDIRDKWRNLLKASNSHTDGEAEERRKTTARLIPKHILHRVRELASLLPYDSPRSRSTSRRKKKKKRS